MAFTDKFALIVDSLFRPFFGAKGADLNLLAPVLGLEKEILVEMKQDSSEQEQRLDDIVVQTDKGVINQIYSRYKDAPSSANSEDRLGHLFDRACQRDLSCLEDILKYDLLYLIRKLFGPFPLKRVVIIHPKNEGFFCWMKKRFSFPK